MAETRPEITLPISIPTLNVRAIASEANTFRRLPQSSNSRICCPMSLAPVSSAIQPTEYSTPAHSPARRAFVAFAESNPPVRQGPGFSYSPLDWTHETPTLLSGPYFASGQLEASTCALLAFNVPL